MGTAEAPEQSYNSLSAFFIQCREALTTRQKLIAQDYKVSYSLAKSCKSDLKKYRCNVENLPRSREARLSYLLMCLESAVHRGESLFLFILFIQSWIYILKLHVALLFTYICSFEYSCALLFKRVFFLEITLLKAFPLSSVISNFVFLYISACFFFFFFYKVKNVSQIQIL